MTKNYRSILTVFAVLPLFYGCADDHTDEIPTDCTNVHWTHQGEHGQEHWTDLCTGFSTCGGSSQSPINITGAVPGETLSPLEPDYGFTSIEIENNGHTIEFVCDAGSSLTVGNMQYQLLQFHYHGNSENTVEGTQYPLEVHFVNKATDGTYAVIGLFFTDGGDTTNALFSQFLAQFPTEEGTYENDSIELDLSSLLPSNLSYYNYSGSLTTPPCSETVSWYVLKNTVAASTAQIAQFQAILDNNFREVQPLNGRVIYSFDE
jgi:carbonic anhydrase